MKILISGGHLTPALAVIHAIRQRSPRTQIVFVGREYMQEKEKMQSREREEIEKQHMKFYEIPAAKFHRTHVFRNVEEFFRFIPSIKKSYDIITAEKPDIFLSFGGYLAVPLALVSYGLHVPVLTHEQTKTAGMANQLIAHVATKVLISYEDSKQFFPRKKTLFTGNPLRPSFARNFRKKPEWLKQVPLTLPLVYVTGGSQGSHIINQTLRNILPELTQSYLVVHQCGASQGSSYLHDLEEARNALPPQKQKRYILREWISEEDVAWLFQHAALVVARSGANTVHEIAVSKVPAIFIPLPFAHNNEQVKNAMPLVEQGSAVILPQKDLVPSMLLQTIRVAIRRKETMQKHAELMGTQEMNDAASRIAEYCFTLYEYTKHHKK